MANIVKFPNRPFNGMRFTDSWRRRWRFDSNEKSWRFDGFAPDIPLADEENIGLLSPQFKQLINSVSEKAGGFGIVTKFSFGKTQTNGFNGVLSGDVKMVSNAFDITCVNAPLNPELNRHPVIDINFSDDFLESMCVEVPAEKGPKGRKGIKGPKGKPGTGDGPQGLSGDAGVDAVGVSDVSEVEVVFDESFYSSAVTEIFLDAPNAILSITKSDALVPDENTPASEVVTSPVIRDIEFTDDDTFDYRVVTVPGVTDPIEAAVDPFVLAYGNDFDPKQNRKLKVAAEGCCCEEADSAEVIAKRLTDYVDQVVVNLEGQVADINEQYDEELKEFIFRKDEEARKALDALVQKLSDEEFKEPFEYCMSLADNGICGQCECNELKKFRQDPYNNPGNFTLCGLNNLSTAIDGLCECLGTSTLALSSGQSSTTKNISTEVTNSYDIPTLSQNSGLVSTQAVSDCSIPSASDFDQFTTGICAFANSILKASGFSNTNVDDFCKTSSTTNLGIIRIAAGESQVITGPTGANLVAGGYILQYRGGSIFDAGNTQCGYVVGSGTNKIGLVLTKFHTNEDGDVEEMEIPWPTSSLVQNPFDKDEVEESYLIGPITELAIGAVIEDNDRLVIEAVARDRSTGVIELSLSHCSRCVSTII